MERRKFLKLIGLSTVSVLALRELDLNSEIAPVETYPLKATFSVASEEELLNAFGMKGRTPMDAGLIYAPYMPVERELWMTRVPV